MRSNRCVGHAHSLRHTKFRRVVVGRHYVPREYLRGFEVTDEPGLVWMYDKVSRKYAKLPIAAVAQQSEYYDADTEKALNESVEGPAQACLSRMRCGGSLSSDDRACLAMYIGVLIMRGPRKRRVAMELLPEVVNDVTRQTRARIDEWAGRSNADPQLVARRRVEVNSLEVKFADDPPPSLVEIVRSPWPSDRAVAAIASMTWRIPRAGGPNGFLASDNPAYLFEVYGLASPEAELTLPLSSNLALLADWQGETGSLLAYSSPERIVKEVNRRVAAGSERYVFYHEERDWVPKVSDKRNPYLSRIQWP